MWPIPPKNKKKPHITFWTFSIVESMHVFQSVCVCSNCSCKRRAFYKTSYFTWLQFRGVVLHTELLLLSEDCVVLPVAGNCAEYDFTCGTFDEAIKGDALLEFKPSRTIWSSAAVYERAELYPCFGCRVTQLSVDTGCQYILHKLKSKNGQLKS